MSHDDRPRLEDKGQPARAGPPWRRWAALLRSKGWTTYWERGRPAWGRFPGGPTGFTATPSASSDENGGQVGSGPTVPTTEPPGPKNIPQEAATSYPTRARTLTRAFER